MDYSILLSLYQDTLFVFSYRVFAADDGGGKRWSIVVRVLFYALISFLFFSFFRLLQRLFARNLAIETKAKVGQIKGSTEKNRGSNQKGSTNYESAADTKATEMSTISLFVVALTRCHSNGRIVSRTPSIGIRIRVKRESERVRKSGNHDYSENDRFVSFDRWETRAFTLSSPIAITLIVRLEPNCALPNRNYEVTCINRSVSFQYLIYD